jgi:sulfonate transport system substrate-binding protein
VTSLISRRRALGLGALGAVGALAACSSSPSASTTSVKDSYALQVGFISNTRTETGPEGWAYKNGTLLAGLRGVGVSSVSFTDLANGPLLMDAIEAGSLDLGLLGDTPAVSGTANGITTRLVNQSFIGLDTWLYTAKDGPSTIADLAGKTVSTQVGSYMYRYLVSVLRDEGIYDSVKITHIYTTDAVAAMQSGGIAGYAAPAGQTTALLSAAGFRVIDKASVDHRDLLGTDLTVIAPGTFSVHPDLPHAWNKARAAGVAAMNANSAAYNSWEATAELTPEADVTIATPISGYPAEPFTSAGLSLLNGVNSFLVNNKLTKSALDIDSWKVPNP